jgi:two-component system sensor histidine kinase TctE
VQAAGSSVLLEVQDSGPGIPDAERDKVFTPFYRIAATLEANPTGSGLGLAIAHEIAALHKARVVLGGIEGENGLKVSAVFPMFKDAPGELS